MREAYDFLKSCKTYFLATTQDGSPRVRPFGTIDMYKGRLYIQTGRSKSVYRQLCDNPALEICAFDGERWLRMSARAVPDDDIEAQRHMLDAYPELKGMYAAGDGNTAVFWLSDAEATIYSFTAPPRRIEF